MSKTRDRKRVRIAPAVAAAVVVLALGTACNFPLIPTAVPETDLATRVAATLTALAPSPSDTPFQPAGQATDTPTPTPTTTSTPRAPSGLRVVYTDAGNVWLLELGRQPVQLSNNGGAERVLISGDGTKVVFQRRTSFEAPQEIWAVDADGTDPIVLIGPSSLDSLYSVEELPHPTVSSMVFIPGTHTLMFNTLRQFEGPGLLKNDDLHVLNLDTGALMTLLPPGDGGDFTLSPDGSRVAVVQPMSVHLFNSDGSQPRFDRITFAPLVTYSEFQFYPNPVWMPDSSAFGVVIPSEDTLDPNATGDVWRVEAASGQTTKLGTIVGNFFLTEFLGGQPSLSSGFDRTAYLRQPAGQNVRTLYLALPAGTNAVAYDSDDVSWQGWAPGGGAFLYTKGAPAQLYLGRVDQAPALVGPGTQAEWISPTEFLYLQGSRGNWTLMKGMLGAASVPLVSPAGDFIQYDFAP